MARLAYNASSAFGRVVSPVIARKLTSVHAVDDNHRPGATAKPLFDLPRDGSKAAIVAGHQQSVRFARGDNHFAKSLLGDRKRLFDEDGFTTSQCLCCKLRMRIVPRSYEDNLRLPVAKNLLIVSRRIGKAKLFRRVLRAEPGCCTDTQKLNLPRALDVRQQHTT